MDRKTKCWECKHCSCRSPISATHCSGCGYDLGLFGHVVEESTGSETTANHVDTRECQKKKKTVKKYVKTDVDSHKGKKYGVWIAAAMMLLVVSGAILSHFTNGGLPAPASDSPAMRVTTEQTASTIPTTPTTLPAPTVPETTATEVMTEATSVPETTQSTQPAQSGAYGRLRLDVATMRNNRYEGTCFGSDLNRASIESIFFLDTLSAAPADSWDVSEKGDGSVLAWVENGGTLSRLCITGEGGVKAPKDCGMLFAGYINLQEVYFQDNFHTDDATTMQYMFANCENLKSLDLSCFNTPSVTSFAGMFWGCQHLEKIVLDGFDTSQATNLKSMFYDCYRLESLDLSSFVTSKVTDMSYMFRTCRSLKELDLSSFDTAMVKNMKAMFNGCVLLEDLNISSFDTSSVANMSWMFRNCSAVSLEDIRHFDTKKVSDYEKFMDGNGWKNFFQK